MEILWCLSSQSKSISPLSIQYYAVETEEERWTADNIQDISDIIAKSYR